MMLQSLHVHNFALLEDAHVEFSSGFNVFTGETGAGKSILIDAFSIVLGGRASGDFLRSGADSFWIQAVFDVGENAQVRAILQEQGIEAEEQLFLKRLVSAGGKPKALINGVQVPLQVVRSLAECLVDIHGQHENQVLLKPEAARIFTDQFASDAILPVQMEYAQLYAEYLSAADKLTQLQNADKDRDYLMDIYRHTVEEIKAAALREGEEEELRTEAGILEHGERIMDAVTGCHDLLDKEQGILSMLSEAKENLAGAVRYDEQLKGLYDSMDSAWLALNDVRSELSGYADGFDFNAQRLEEIQQRLDLLRKLQKKYGGTVTAVLARAEETAAKLAELEQIGEAVAQAEHQLDIAKKKLAVVAEKLTVLRQKFGQQLAQQVTNHIHDLAMPDGKIQITIDAKKDFSPCGADDMGFLFSANKGEPLCQLMKVASGGELSRVALAMKTVLSTTQNISCMVFDEIDTGVGGITAEHMAEKLAMLAKRGQVLCITHLPQIAAYAHRHIYIEKMAKDDRTVTELTVLDKAGRIAELVRMASGSNATTAAVKVAKELLEKGAAFEHD